MDSHDILAYEIKNILHEPLECALLIKIENIHTMLCCSTIHNRLWLKIITREVLRCTRILHVYLGADILENGGATSLVEDKAYLLLQVLIQLRLLETTLKAERKNGDIYRKQRWRYIGNLLYCLQSLKLSLRDLSRGHFIAYSIIERDPKPPHITYNDLISQLRALEINTSNGPLEGIIAAKMRGTVLAQNRRLRPRICMWIQQALQYADVQLECDKRMLTFLCGNVVYNMKELMDLRMQIMKSKNFEQSIHHALVVDLEDSIFRLEEYLNRTMLRVIFYCFLNYEDFWPEQIYKAVVNASRSEHAKRMITRFQDNLVRTLYIGMYALEHVQDMKMRTILRSCMKSLEEIAAYIKSKTIEPNFLILLEKHFYEELTNFKIAILCVLDSSALTVCYHDMLFRCIENAKLHAYYGVWQAILNMAQLVFEHFDLADQQAMLRQTTLRQSYYEDFKKKWRECRAALYYFDSISIIFVVQRFKSLHVILNKFIETLSTFTQLNQNYTFEPPSAKNYACKEACLRLYYLEPIDKFFHLRLNASLKLGADSTKTLPSRHKRRNNLRPKKNYRLQMEFQQKIKHMDKGDEGTFRKRDAKEKNCAKEGNSREQLALFHLTQAQIDYLVYYTTDEVEMRSDAGLDTDIFPSNRRFNITRQTGSVRMVDFKRGRIQNSPNIIQQYKNLESSKEINELIEQISLLFNKIANAKDYDESDKF